MLIEQEKLSSRRGEKSIVKAKGMAGVETLENTIVGGNEKSLKCDMNTSYGVKWRMGE